MSREQLKVIIVGGSITGLTLAHCLHRIGVDYTILEKRAEVVLQEGASVGIMPNGARILHQLGLYTAIEKAAASLGASDLCFPDGFTFRSTYPARMLEHFGYPISFMERRKLLEILYSALPDKTKVHVSKEVRRIEQDDVEEKGVVSVWTADGDVYEGDVVVGADGVRSQTRAEMQRMASLSGNAETGQNTMSAEYSCCFGISAGVEHLKPGTQVLHMDDGRSLMLVPSKDRLVFWFVIQKLDRRYQSGETPRFTSDEAVALCSQLADTPCFRDVWDKRKVFNMVAIEEGVVRTWSFGRVVCIGDSIHKGRANCAIEDAAVLTNLVRESLLTKRPTSKEVENLLRRFNQVHYPRVVRISDVSWTVVRLHARDGLVMKLVGRYLMPYMGGKKRLVGRAFGLIGDAAALDFLPLPRDSYPGWRKKGRGFKFGLAVLASILVLVTFLCYR
ncbi:hypothetical protein L249_3726 [Ophiocordyceps polyrhachis-furcata BCC 54312]|uniref:FAD-binding domain-containing protein n=1 Tax=Ophiocordyceps polyrhachis-furcata BCC 54312 TaxID=1330021 RepID=A0A367L4P3_9HYPO|nr:hypothetical protein L249_3726 [Ophiocordyceps polyrhachis-furcata BCC 54312]